MEGKITRILRRHGWVILPWLLNFTPAPARAQQAVPGVGIQITTLEPLGAFLVTEQGFTLYTLQDDDIGISTCLDDCARLWPPLLRGDDLMIGRGIDISLVGTLERSDGAAQLTYNGWPLYTHVEDQQPGDVTGQGAGRVWAIISPSGERLETGNPTPADQALDEGRTAAKIARETGAPTNPDNPLWAKAIAQGRRARQLAPDDPEILRFLAETYTATRWYIRAWEAWQAYLDSGGELDESAREMMSATGNQLAYLTYQRQELSAALALYRQVIDVDNENLTAVIWAGRILLELGHPDQSLPFWRQASMLAPDDEGIAYFLQLARDEVRYGTQATQDFYQGINFYEAGDAEAALQVFLRAGEENPAFKQAFVWAGRASLHLGQPAAAASYWQRVLELDPSDERARFFLGVAQDQLRWGIAAADAFREGVRLYDQGDLGQAQAEFQSATEANAQYAEAWAWLGRTEFEQQAYQAAAQAYGQALALEPDNETYRYFQEESTRRQTPKESGQPVDEVR